MPCIVVQIALPSGFGKRQQASANEMRRQHAWQQKAGACEHSRACAVLHPPDATLQVRVYHISCRTASMSGHRH